MCFRKYQVRATDTKLSFHHRARRARRDFPPVRLAFLRVCIAYDSFSLRMKRPECRNELTYALRRWCEWRGGLIALRKKCCWMEGNAPLINDCLAAGCRRLFFPGNFGTYCFSERQRAGSAGLPISIHG